MKKNSVALICFIIFSALFSVSSVSAAGASLYLSPSTGSYDVGSIFSVKVRVNAGGSEINAAEGVLTFDSNKLAVVSVSKSNSIFSLWPIEPSFSSGGGTITFGGGTPSPYSGSSGEIVTITFKVKAAGSAQVRFTAGSVLAADGRATELLDDNVLANMEGGSYAIKSVSIIPDQEEVAAETEYVGVPKAPVVTSATHPNPDKWYPNSSPEFSWSVPLDVTEVRLLLDSSPTSIPSVSYAPPISKRKIENLEDGVWYFHIRFNGSSGLGGVLHRKVLIDTIAPDSFNIIVDNESDPTNPAPILIFSTKDSLSGVEYYEVKIDQGEPEIITAAYLQKDYYRTPLQPAGKHTVVVKAFDYAGNQTIATVDFSIVSIKPPAITEYSEKIEIGDVMTIKGTSGYPDATVKVFVKKEGEEPVEKEVETDKAGNWSFIYEKSLTKGTYQVWAQVIDNRGAQSDYTKKITISATLPALLKFGKVALDYLTILMTLLSLLVVSVLVSLYAWYRISVWQKRLRKETQEVAHSVAKAFRALREEVQEQIEDLDSKPKLSKKEKEVRDKLEEALNVSEEYINKEIRDVEKELE